MLKIFHNFFFSFIIGKKKKKNTRQISSPRSSPREISGTPGRPPLPAPASPACALQAKYLADVETALKSSSSVRPWLLLSTGRSSRQREAGKWACGDERWAHLLHPLKSEGTFAFPPAASQAAWLSCLPHQDLTTQLIFMVFNNDTGQVFNPVSKHSLPAKSL